MLLISKNSLITSIHLTCVQDDRKISERYKSINVAYTIGNYFLLICDTPVNHDRIFASHKITLLSFGEIRLSCRPSSIEFHPGILPRAF